MRAEEGWSVPQAGTESGGHGTWGHQGFQGVRATGTSPHTPCQQDPSFSLKRQCSRPHHVGTREQTEKDLKQALVKAEQDRCEKKKSAGTASEAMRQGERCLDVYLLGHISPSHGPMHAQQEGECERPSWPQPGGRGCGESRGGTSKQQLQHRHDEPESPPDLRL